MFNNWVIIYIFNNIFNFPFPITVDMIVLLTNYYDIVFLLIIIFVFVCWILFQIFFNFYKKDNAIYYGLFTTKTNHFFLEFIWTIIPMVIFFLIFIPIFKLVRVIGTSSNLTMTNINYCSFLNSKENTKLVLNTFGTTIKIIGNQWYWLYEYDLSSTVNNGLEFDMDEFVYSYMLDEESINNYNLIGDWDSSLRLLSTDYGLVVNRNIPIRFIITSYDVIHSWSLPSAGIKVDASPGRITSFKTIFKLNGLYYGQCSELCGFLHGFMPISIKVV